MCTSWQQWYMTQSRSALVTSVRGNLMTERDSVRSFSTTLIRQCAPQTRVYIQRRNYRCEISTYCFPRVSDMQVTLIWPPYSMDSFICRFITLTANQILTAFFRIYRIQWPEIANMKRTNSARDSFMEHLHITIRIFQISQKLYTTLLSIRQMCAVS
jgi:hypothetical protein